MTMAMTRLPRNGELKLGGITLPPGHRITPEDVPAPVAWVTRRTVPNPGATWAALRALHGQTGLVPGGASGGGHACSSGRAAGRPWTGLATGG